MGFRAAQWAYSLTANLTTAQLCILRQAAWSCRDDDGYLPRSRSWLGEKCAVSIRSLERHLPQLDKLRLLIWNGKGFRLPAYLSACGNLGTDRQIGGCAGAGTANLSANLRKEKESTKEKESLERESMGRASGTARPNASTLRKIWGAIAGAGRFQNANLEPRLWDELDLIAVDAHVMRVTVRRPWEGWEREVTKAAERAQMLRGRRVEIVEVLD